MKITVYHGATVAVEVPSCSIGRPRLDSGIAKDRVIDTVNLYITGFYDAVSALQQLAFHKPNNQICLRSQVLTDKYLKYDGTQEI